MSRVRVADSALSFVYAGVAELADAPDLGSGGFTVWVQVPSPAPIFNSICGSGSVVEHRLAKARVASSNLVSRSANLKIVSYSLEIFYFSKTQA